MYEDVIFQNVHAMNLADSSAVLCSLARMRLVPFIMISAWYLKCKLSVKMMAGVPESKHMHSLRHEKKHMMHTLIIAKYSKFQFSIYYL